MSDLFPLTEVSVGSVAVVYIGRVILELVKGHRAPGPHSTPPPASHAMPGQVQDIHEIVTVKDQDGVPRVLNKPSVERAILETAAHASRQTSLLEDIADSLSRQRQPTIPGE